MTSRRVALWVAATLLASACGKSKEEEAFEEIARQCSAATSEGLTLRQIDQGLAAGANWGVFELPCSNSITSIATPGSPQNQCTPPQEDPQCPVFFMWLPNDPDLYEPTGSCLACEVRQNESAISGVDRADVPVCGSRFRRGVCCPGAEC